MPPGEQVAENTADKALQIARLDTRLCLRLAKVAFSDWADQVHSHENYYTVGKITTRLHENYYTAEVSV